MFRWLSSVIVTEILKCLTGGSCLALNYQRWGQKGLHSQIRSKVLYLVLLFLCDTGFLCRIICNLFLYLTLHYCRSLKHWLCFWFSFLYAYKFYGYVFSFYYSLIVMDYRKNFVFVVLWGIHILSIFLSKISITWLLAIRVELNVVTLSVVPFSPVFLSSTSSKAAVVISSDGKKREGIVILWVTRSLSHWSVMLQIQILYMYLPLSMQQAGELNLQSSDILPALWMHALKFCIYPEELSRDKWARWHSAQNVYVIRANMLSAYVVQGDCWRAAVVQYHNLLGFCSDSSSLGCLDLSSQRSRNIVLEHMTLQLWSWSRNGGKGRGEGAVPSRVSQQLL